MAESNTILYYLVAVAIAGAITVLLRALPFAILKKLRSSRFVKKLGLWMPVGIMLILAFSTAFSALTKYDGLWWAVPVALSVTIAVHYLTKRNTTLSVVAGTAVYVVIINLLA